MLAILTNLSKQLLSLIMNLIWLQVNLLEPRADKLLHFSSVSINSYLENKFHSFTNFLGISSRTWISTSCIWAELKELCRAFQRSSSSIHECPSYWIALCYNSKLLELDYEITLYWITQENLIESSFTK